MCCGKWACGKWACGKWACGKWAGVVADVSGKGIPAALLSSMVLGALSTEFRAGVEAPEVLNRINRLICDKSLDDQFVTLFVFVMNPDGTGEYIGAGHNPAFVFRSATAKVERLTSEHFFLGMFDSAVYESRPLQLSNGDVLVVYSDGVTDAENRDGQMLGTARLLEVIRREAPAGGAALERGLLRAIEEFTGGTPQSDDITFVIVEKHQ